MTKTDFKVAKKDFKKNASELLEILDAYSNERDTSNTSTLNLLIRENAKIRDLGQISDHRCRTKCKPFHYMTIR